MAKVKAHEVTGHEPVKVLRYAAAAFMLAAIILFSYWLGNGPALRVGGELNRIKIQMNCGPLANPGPYTVKLYKVDEDNRLNLAGTLYSAHWGKTNLFTCVPAGHYWLRLNAANGDSEQPGAPSFEVEFHVDQSGNVVDCTALPIKSGINPIIVCLAVTFTGGLVCLILSRKAAEDTDDVEDEVSE